MILKKTVHHGEHGGHGEKSWLFYIRVCVRGVSS